MNNDWDATSFLRALSPATPSAPIPGYDIRLATIAIVNATNGGVTVIFDGETSDSGMYYRFLSDYTPVAGDRVVMQKIGRTYVCYGPIDVQFAGPRVLYRNNLGVTTGTMSWNIPSHVSRIRIDWSARSTGAAVLVELACRFNGISTASYNSSRSQLLNVTQTNFINSGGNTYALAGVLFGTTATAGCFSSGSIDVDGWNNLNANGHLRLNHRSSGYDGVAADSFVVHGGGLYNGGGAPTSIQLSCNVGSFAAASDFLVTVW